MALTQRELEVLDLTAHGLSTKEAAVELGCGFKTVIKHRASIQRKLGARNVTHAVAIAISSHLIELLAIPGKDYAVRPIASEETVGDN